MRKYLHIEQRPTGLYVYVDDKKRGGTPLTIEDMDEECCIADGLCYEKIQELSIFRGKTHVVIDVNQLFKDAKKL
jgi:hypothetical protein